MEEEYEDALQWVEYGEDISPQDGATINVQQPERPGQTEQYYHCTRTFHPDPAMVEWLAWWTYNPMVVGSNLSGRKISQKIWQGVLWQEMYYCLIFHDWIYFEAVIL